MRERVALFDGQLEAEPLPGRGFRVYASLPYDAGPMTGLRPDTTPAGVAGSKP